MPFRIGAFDIAVAVVVLVAIFLPARATHVSPVYPEDATSSLQDVSRYQALLIQEPADGNAAYELSELLLRLGQTDWALQVAAAAVAEESSPTRWRAMLALASAHVDRFEIVRARDHARAAVAACQTATTCPSHERARLLLFTAELEAGARSGVDPKLDPRGFRRAIRNAYPRATFRKRGASTP